MSNAMDVDGTHERRNVLHLLCAERRIVRLAAASNNRANQTEAFYLCTMSLVWWNAVNNCAFLIFQQCRLWHQHTSCKAT